MSQETRPSPKNATSHATAKPARVSALRPRTDLTRVLTSPAGISVGSPAPLAAPPLEDTSSVTIGVTLETEVAEELMKTADVMGMTLGQTIATMLTEWVHDSKTEAALRQDYASVSTLPAPDEDSKEGSV